ncbi:MAG: glycosyltransferase, partial [Caldisphaeraceae archaeon]|nr:glycosyltransferase [Caldisphaeraceae archaeon]
KNIVTDEESLGGKIFLALKHCRGSIVTFLEDDDLYRQDRLEKIYEAFKKHNIVFFYNDQEFIDEEGRVTKKTNPTINKTLVVPHNLKKRLSSYLDYYHVGGNNSSLAIKAECIRRFSSLIKENRLLFDTLLYLISFACDGGIFIESEKLTLYRIYGSSSSCRVSYFNSYEAWARCLVEYYHKVSYDITKNAVLSLKFRRIYPNIYTLAFLNHVLSTNNCLPIGNKQIHFRIGMKDLIKHMKFDIKILL